MKYNIKIYLLYIIFNLFFLSTYLNAEIRVQINNFKTSNVHKILTTDKYVLLFNNDGKLSILDKNTQKVYKEISIIPYIVWHTESIFMYKNEVSFPSKSNQLTILNLNNFSTQTFKVNTDYSGAYGGGAVGFSDKYLFVNGSLYDINKFRLLKINKYSSSTKKVILDDKSNRMFLIYEDRIDIYDIKLGTILKNIYIPLNLSTSTVSYSNKKLYYLNTVNVDFDDPSKNKVILNIFNIESDKAKKLALGSVIGIQKINNEILVAKYIAKYESILSLYDINKEVFTDLSIKISTKRTLHALSKDGDSYYISIKGEGVSKITKDKKIYINQSNGNSIFYFEKYKKKNIYYSISMHKLSIQASNKQQITKIVSIDISNIKNINLEYSTHFKVYKFNEKRFILIENNIYRYIYATNELEKIHSFGSKIKSMFIVDEEEKYVFLKSGIIKLLGEKKIKLHDMKIEEAIVQNDNVIIKETSSGCLLRRFNIVDNTFKRIMIHGNCDTLTSHPTNQNELILFEYGHGYSYSSQDRVLNVNMDKMSYIKSSKFEYMDSREWISFNLKNIEVLGTGKNGSLNIFDFLSFVKKGEIKDAYDKKINYMKVEDEFLYVAENNKISIYDSKNYNLLLEQYIFNDAMIYLTPEGYFSGFGKLEKYMHYVKNEVEIIQFNQLYDHFFRPDLVKLKLAGEDISKYTNGLTYQDALSNPPPKLAFNSIDSKEVKLSGFSYNDVKTKKEKVKLSFNVNEHDNGGVGLIRVYQEGKLIQTIGKGKINKQSANVDTLLEQEKLDITNKENQKTYIASLSKSINSDVNMTAEDTIAIVKPSDITNNSGTYNLEIELKSGKNEISIEAFNKTNTVTSYRENITINADIPKHKPRLYVIAAGVNEFEIGSVNNLKYSQNDAKAIKEAAENKMGTVFDKVEVKYLLGKEVTKANILKAANEISKVARLDDTVLFYISTHGRAYKGKLYLVPYNNKSVANWIDFEQTFKAVQSIKALNQIFIIDACESGKANDIVSSVYDSRASVLAKSSGVHMLLATTKGTSAFEHPDPSIKNGVFTHRILEAMKDKTTDKNNDKLISVLELSKKLKEPSNNSDYQHPVIRNVGNDILLERVGK